MSITAADLDGLDFAKADGLLPAIVQHADSGAVLMLGYMNREALERTLARGRVVFFSRSKGRLWEKGETSGHSLEVKAIRADCDRDALLVTAQPRGPTCHRGTLSCFGDGSASALGFLGELEGIIEARKAARAENSYTAKLFAAGTRRIGQKVGEEAVEVALAGVAGSGEEVVAEAADLLYHLLVLLRCRGVAIADVVEELRARHREAP